MKILPEKEFKDKLLGINMPGRYTGGEYGSIIKKDSDFITALSFPDLYEIGMSNQAVKILYELINNQTESSCERVFAPAPDMEQLLRDSGIPLYTLETGTPLNECDILAFSIGYELSATNILNIIDLGGIPVRNIDRSESDPIVIAGGPAATNPMPFAEHIDAVFIGEAEAVVPLIIKKLSALKKSGAGRKVMLDMLKNSEHFWCKDKTEITGRAVWTDFGKTVNSQKLIVPSVSTVQDHGVVEIMRGCPNGCRFCHAGLFYRPYRQKSIDTIIGETEKLIKNCGYREITLSSLSSGDYKGIDRLIGELNNRYSGKRISFSFPSMRVNGFTLPLINEISRVRKSGLTFAVETPDISHQRGLNKEVAAEKVIEILKEAKRAGWKKAKFYFMIGLPFFRDDSEADAIIDYLRRVGRETGMFLNVNIGTFIPKPHTPYQWSFQLTEQESLERIMKIKNALPPRFFKVGFQSPFMSMLEGIISRGDQRTGELIEAAFRDGARLDAWEEYLKKDVWRKVVEECSWDAEKETCRERDPDETLPWDSISLNAGKGFLRNELKKSMQSELTDECSEDCMHNCGVCSGDVKAVDAVERDSAEAVTEKPDSYTVLRSALGQAAAGGRKVVFKFKKTGRSVFLSHINLMNIFERAFVRAGLKVSYTEGFNPKPRLEFADPLSLGIESMEEIAAVELENDSTTEEISAIFEKEINNALPDGLVVNEHIMITTLESADTGRKVRSLMSMYSGSAFKIKIKTSGDWHKKLINALKDSEVPFNLDEEEGLLTVDNNTMINGTQFNFLKFARNELEMINPFEHFDITKTANYASANKTGNLSDAGSYFAVLEHLRI